MKRPLYLILALLVTAPALSTTQAAVTDPPQPVSPADGSAVSTLGPVLEWSNPPGTVQYHLQVVPAHNDGPGINLIGGSAQSSLAIPAPPNWFGLLPDMTYSWRVRASDATSGLGEGDAGWGPWSDDSRFRTPAASSGDITLNTTQVSGRTPTLSWSNRDPSIYYYEVQVSRDPGFGPGAFLYWELRHGGVTSPRNSYAVPSQYPLESGATYYWRVRPRVQGDGTPTGWTPAQAIRVPGGLFLQIGSPSDESVVGSASVQVTGKTAPGAIVTVNESLATVDGQGNFSATISVAEGPNEVSVLATDMSGSTAETAITVTYIPPA